jgi:hypothetical protein
VSRDIANRGTRLPYKMWLANTSGQRKSLVEIPLDPVTAVDMARLPNATAVANGAFSH